MKRCFIKYDLRNQWDNLSKEIMTGCGLSYELYQRRMSAGIENIIEKLPAEIQEDAFKLARAEYDYITNAEIKELDRELSLCSHGLDPYYCPCGCGDIDYQ